MKSGRFIFMAVAVFTSAWPAFSQTTNFIPKTPPRSYTTVVQLANMEMNGAVSRDGGAENFFAPTMGSLFDAPNASGGDRPQAAPRSDASRVKRRPPQDGGAKPSATLSEIVANSGRANDPALREGGVISEIMKQRAVSQRAAMRVREDAAQAKAEEDADAEARGPAVQPGLRKDSVWHSAEDVAAVLAEQGRRAGSASLLGPAKDSADPFFRSARGSSGSMFDGGSPSFFGASQAAPQNSPFFAPADFTRDDSLLRAPAPPPSAFGGNSGAGDLKKPATLPW